jgi:hypothetical protein
MRTPKSNTGAHIDIPQDVRDLAALIPLINDRLRRAAGGETVVTRTTVVNASASQGMSIAWRTIAQDSEQRPGERLAVILVDTSAGPVVFRLLPFSAVKGAVLAVKKSSLDSNTVTIKAAEGENIDGQPEIVLSQVKACWIGGANAVA